MNTLRARAVEPVQLVFFINMARAFGLVTVGACVLALAVAWISYRLIRNFLRMWNVLKPVPSIGVAYPLLGHALQLKSGAGGERSRERVTLISI